jgi:hypothetical protein
MFRHVNEYVGLDEEQPTHGRSPDLKLVTHPPMHSQDVLDAREDAVLWATAFSCCSGFCGLAICFGASTVTLGSVSCSGVVGCDIAGLPSSNAIAQLATNGPATKNDEFFTLCPPKSWDGISIPTGMLAPIEPPETPGEL